MNLAPSPLILAFAVTALSATLPAQRQDPSQEQLIELRAKKLAKPVFHEPLWETDYDAARARAQKEGKLLFAYFTRSYAA